MREERTFTISDGTEVQAWLVRDPERDGPLPLLLDVHGGPHNAWNAAADEMHFYHQELAARGWAVLLVNPRGSDGYGEAFYDGVQGAWGVADHHDFLEPIDALVAEGLADPDRLAVTGYSYGGFMTCWLTAPRRPVQGRGRRRRRQRPGQQYGASDDGAPDGSLRARRRAVGATPRSTPRCRRSPASTRSRTPTLVLHGEDDLTCPVGQAQQWHTSLRDRGVPTELVLYPGASHVFILLGPPSQRLDYSRRVVDWVERYAVQGGRPRIDVAHWERRLAKLASKHRVPGAQLGILRLTTGRRRRARRRVVRRAQHRHRRAGHRRLALPDRLDHQGLDGDGRHAAGRRGAARPGRPGRRGAARAAARRPRRHQAGDAAAPAHPHQRHRRRRLHRHRPRRRLPREVRRRCSARPRRTTRSAPPGPTATRASRCSAG